MLITLVAGLVVQLDAKVDLHLSDASPLSDPSRPVSEIRRDGFIVQWATSTSTPTQIQIREDILPATAFGREVPAAWRTIAVREQGTWHRLNVTGLKPGRRYFYRVFDPETRATTEELAWGAGEGYRREYAVSTLAPRGRKTIIRIPIKVLLMPNVINVSSALADPSAQAPVKLTDDEIAAVKAEYAISSRFFWVNSGMRLWVDYQFAVDDRWQRWGPEPEGATGLYKGLPLNRNYGGKDYTDPGGGVHSIVDFADPVRVLTTPIREPLPYSGQVEQAFVRRWNANTKKWEFYNSGGGTYGVDGWPQGWPGRSQFLGGGDTAWLATHEVHHNLESHGQFSLSNREDDRIVFNHYAPRRRVLNGTSVDQQDWTTNGRHGEHWDGMAFWDRSLSDAQWLRLYFGYTETVADADEDGVPDDDRRLPLDEKRFGSDPRKKATDGLLGDLQKAMLSRWVPAPLQTSWTKPPFQGVIPDPKKKDNDGDGLTDGIDPEPLKSEPMLIPYMPVKVDGMPTEWAAMQPFYQVKQSTLTADYWQSHDEQFFYGCFQIKGDWRRVDLMLDGEGFGVYSGVGVQSLQILNTTLAPASGAMAGSPVDVRQTPFKAPGLRWKASRTGNTTTVEFALPNGGEGLWYWKGGGREIGSQINVFDQQGRGYAMGEPYRVYYARMLEPVGRTPMPQDAPEELSGGINLRLDDPKLQKSGAWELKDGALRYSEAEEEGALVLELPEVRTFDLLAVVEAKNDGIVAAFASGQEVNAGNGYVGFVGGYGNRVTRLRVNGQERGDEPVTMTPGKHRIQLSRRMDGIWLLVDGKPVIWTPDPTPQLVLNRLAILSGYGGRQIIHEIRYRLNP